jgi:hypothetical protein
MNAYSSSLAGVAWAGAAAGAAGGGAGIFFA